VTNASNDLTFDKVEPPMDTSKKKNDTLTVSMEIHKGAIFDRLKVIVVYLTSSCINWIFFGMNGPVTPIYTQMS
jgi:hypothetical protein